MAPARSFVNVTLGSGVLATAPRASRSWRTVRSDHRSDLVERHREHVVEHERESLGRAECVQHDLQRDPDRVRQQRFVLGIGPGRWADVA